VSALARIKGQDYARKILESSLKAGRSASAYLFFGPTGCGKKTAAMALAQALFCQVEPGAGCGECASCRRVEGNKHPDYFVFKPSGASFKVEQVRELLKEASLRPFEAPRRVFVIDKAELLTDSAGNALLKVLEEPNASLLFVLISTARARLLPTIASRCQPLRFGALPEPVLTELLVKEEGMALPEAKALAGLAGGSLRSAKRLLGEEGTQLRELAEGFLEAAASKSSVAQWNWANLAGMDKRRVDELLELIAAYLRELWVAKSGLPKNLALLAQAPKHGGGLAPEHVQRLLLKVAAAQAQLKRNAQLALVLENLALA
jgi:DNA polymerase-3 subunit delta'